MFFFETKYRHLPFATGPYMPGCSDVMLEGPQYGIFMTLFYPTNEKKNYDHYKNWAKCIPGEKYIIGMSKVVMIFTFIVKLVLWWSGIEVFPAIYGAQPKTDKKLKCVIFSHGLGAYRTLFTNLCCELASFGFLVVALEHRDQSACYTYTYSSKDDAKNDKKTGIYFLPVHFGKHHYEKRNKQVHFRSGECIKALNFLINVNKGEVPHNILDDVPIVSNAFSLQSLVNKLDVDDVTMMGHSFGGATALLTLANCPQLKRGVVLDPWMFPIKDENLEQKIQQPLQFINTQTFHIKSNVNVMEKFLERKDREMLTILHTTHEHQTDMVLIIGSWLNLFMRKLEPKLALELNNALVKKFLSQHGAMTEQDPEMERIIEENKRYLEYGLTKPWA